MALWRIIKDNNIVEDFASFTVHCFKNCLRGIKVWLCLFAYDAHGVVCVLVMKLLVLASVNILQRGCLLLLMVFAICFSCVCNQHCLMYGDYRSSLAIAFNLRHYWEFVYSGVKCFLYSPILVRFILLCHVLSTTASTIPHIAPLSKFSFK